MAGRNEAATIGRGGGRGGARTRGDLLDGAAMCASGLCMLHCLALPILLAALPALAGWLDPGESFHAIVLAFAVPTSAVALIGGWRRHRGVAPVAMGAIGLAAMASGIAFASREASEVALTVTGSLLLAGAHLANWRGRMRQPVCG